MNSDKKTKLLIEKFPYLIPDLDKEKNLSLGICIEKVSAWSNEEIWWKCSQCGERFSKCAKEVTRIERLNCQICKESMSFPEKYICKLLEENDKFYIHQKAFPWSNGRIYDFYLPKENIVIEVHGDQHYTESSFSIDKKLTLSARQEIDKMKMDVAIENGIRDYIVVDGRYSLFSFMKKSVRESRLLDMVENTNFDKVIYRFMKSKVVETWKLWDENIYSAPEIAVLLDISQETVRYYLKRGLKLGRLDYNPQEESAKTHFDKKPIVQLSLDGELIKHWDGVTGASENYGCIIASIHQVCTGRTKTCVGYNWMFKEDYDRHLEEGIPISKRRVAMKPTKRLYQLTKDGDIVKIWDRQIEASETIGCHGSSIRKATVTNKLSKGYRWMYESDYNKFINSGEDFQSYQGHFTDGKVVQLSLEGDFIKEWSNTKEASNSFNVKANIVTNACKVDNRTALGYRWKFSHDYFKSKSSFK